MGELYLKDEYNPNTEFIHMKKNIEVAEEAEIKEN